MKVRCVLVCVSIDFFGICANIPVTQGIGCSSAALTSAFRIDTWAECPPSPSCECELMGVDMLSGTIAVSALENDDGVLLQNARGTTRSIEIAVICDRSVATDNAPDPVTDVANHVTMTWRTPLVCEGSVGIGWMFLIFTGVAAGLYVGGGIGYAKHQVCHQSRSVPWLWQLFKRVSWPRVLMSGSGFFAHAIISPTLCAVATAAGQGK